MNHVAHCLLSYPDEALLIGNFIGDYVKGSQWKCYPTAVQRGIQLHRFIDAYSADHVALREAVRYLRPFAGRFAAPVLDILCDHLLCRQWTAWGIAPEFNGFAEWAYSSLDCQRLYMPEQLQRRWPNMLRGRFLHLYQSTDGISWTLERFAHRLSLPLDWKGIVALLESRQLPFEADVGRFFSALLSEVKVWRAQHM